MSHALAHPVKEKDGHPYFWALLTCFVLLGACSRQPGSDSWGPNHLCLMPIVICVHWVARLFQNARVGLDVLLASLVWDREMVASQRLEDFAYVAL